MSGLYAFYLPTFAVRGSTCPPKEGVFKLFLIRLCFRYINGTHYLVERYSYPGVKLEQLLEPWTNTAINFAFPGAMAVVNLVLYLVPLPSFVKAKFRE